MSHATAAAHATTTVVVDLSNASPRKTGTAPAYIGWRTRAYNPCRTSVSLTDGICVRQPSRRWPQITGTEPATMSTQATATVDAPLLHNGGAGACQAMMNPRNHRGMPRRLRRIEVAIRPPGSPQRFE